MVIDIQSTVMNRLLSSFFLRCVAVAVVVAMALYAFIQNSPIQIQRIKIADTSVSGSKVRLPNGMQDYECCTESFDVVIESIQSLRLQKAREQWARAMITLYGRKDGLARVKRKFPDLAQTLSKELTQ